jgi:Do/DeqQ family serine protease
MKEYIKILTIGLISGIIVLGGQQILNNDNEVSTNITDSRTEIKPSNIQQVSINNNAANSSVELPNFKMAANKTLHSVVYILTEFSQKSSVYDDYFNINDFFGRRSNSVLKASGSGVIISSDGYIVTNNHVVQEADKISITLNDKRTYEARVIGTDPTTDLALLKIEEKGLTYVNFGNSDNVQVGDWVLAVGNPFNLTSTVTAGIISAKARNINILGANTAIESFLQTDAVVNPGNSGGALVDINGDLVGINAAIASRTGSYIGYSFAIPVSIVKKVVKDLKEYGTIQRAYLGITIDEVNSKNAKKLGLDSIRGVLVETVLEDGAASKAGIRDGAVILSVDGFAVNSPSELLEKIGLHRPGYKVKLEVVQNHKQKYHNAILTNKYGTTELSKKTDNNVALKLGAQFSNISNELKLKLGISHGQMVKELRPGLLKSAGIRNGFIIMKIGNIIINSEKDITNAFQNVSGGILIEGVYPNGIRAYYGVGL